MELLQLITDSRIYWALMFSAVLISYVYPDSQFDTPCGAGEYYDGVVEMCSKCSDICSFKDGFVHPQNLYCKHNCLDYYNLATGNSNSIANALVMKNPWTTPPRTTLQVIVGVDLHGSNDLVRKPLFWTSVVSLLISVIATTVLVVLCFVRASSRRGASPHGRRRDAHRGVRTSSKTIGTATSANTTKGNSCGINQNGVSSAAKYNELEQTVVRTTVCELIYSSLTEDCHNVTPRYSMSEESGSGGCSSDGAARARSQLVMYYQDVMKELTEQNNSNVVVVTLNTCVEDMGVELTAGDTVEQLGTVSEYHCTEMIYAGDVINTSKQNIHNEYTIQLMKEKKYSNYETLETHLGPSKPDVRNFDRGCNHTPTHSDVIPLEPLVGGLCYGKESDNIFYSIFECVPVIASREGNSQESSFIASAAAGATSAFNINVEMSLPPVVDDSLPLASVLNVKLNNCIHSETESAGYLCMSDSCNHADTCNNKCNHVMKEQRQSFWESLLKSSGVKVRECFDVTSSFVQHGQTNDKFDNVQTISFSSENNIV